MGRSNIAVPSIYKEVHELGYNDFIMDISKEYFVMSPGALISTIGGFLGLFLGFSCLSVTFWTSNYTGKCMK